MTHASSALSLRVSACMCVRPHALSLSPADWICNPPCICSTFHKSIYYNIYAAITRAVAYKKARSLALALSLLLSRATCRQLLLRFLTSGAALEMENIWNRQTIHLYLRALLYTESNRKPRAGQTGRGANNSSDENPLKDSPWCATFVLSLRKPTSRLAPFTRATLSCHRIQTHILNSRAAQLLACTGDRVNVNSRTPYQDKEGGRRWRPNASAACDIYPRRDGGIWPAAAVAVYGI